MTLQSRVNFDQMTLDTFGTGYTLDDDGQPNLAASLREVINAMLRAGRAAAIGPQVVLTTEGPHAFPASAVDAAGNQWLFWVKGTDEIWFTHQVSGGAWTPPTQWRTLTGPTAGVAVVGAPDGTVWVFWNDRVAANQFDIFGQVFRAGAWEPEFTVNAGGANVFAQNLSAGVDVEIKDMAFDGLGGALGMKRGQDQVPSLGGGDGCGGGLQVSHLADEDHVGILAQYVAQAAGEIRHIAANLALFDQALIAFQVILDGVFQRDDVMGVAQVDRVDH